MVRRRAIRSLAVHVPVTIQTFSSTTPCRATTHPLPNTTGLTVRRADMARGAMSAVNGIAVAALSETE